MPPNFRNLFQVEVHRSFCLIDCLVEVKSSTISEVIVKNRNFVRKNNRDRLRGGGLKKVVKVIYIALTDKNASPSVCIV